MNRSILLGVNGHVLAISIIATEYPHECPPLITFENFTRMKCINQTDHLNPASWVEIEPIEE